MFNNQHYITKGIQTELCPALQMILWYLIETMQIETKDYLQIFDLYEDNGAQMVKHTQEQPSYTKIDTLTGFIPITAKVFVIEDTTHSTMMLAEEY